MSCDTSCVVFSVALGGLFPGAAMSAADLRQSLQDWQAESGREGKAAGRDAGQC